MTNELQEKKYYGGLLKDAEQIIERSQQHAYVAINTLMVERNWLLGKRIAEEELQGEDRAKYGTQLIKQLSVDLTGKYGKGFSYVSLYGFVRFYKCFPEIFYTVRKKSDENIFHTCGKSIDGNFAALGRKSDKNILDSVSPKSLKLLSWSHYRILLQVDDDEARAWYTKEAFEQTWNLSAIRKY